MASLGACTLPDSSTEQTLRAFYIRRFFALPAGHFLHLPLPLMQVPQHPTSDYHWIGSRLCSKFGALTEPVLFRQRPQRAMESAARSADVPALPLAYLSIRRYRFGSFLLLSGAVIAALTLPQLTSRLRVFSFARACAGIMAYDLCRESRRRLPSWIWLW